MVIVLEYYFIFLINPVLALMLILMAIRYKKVRIRKYCDIIYPFCMASTMAYIGYWARHGTNIGDIDRYLLFQESYVGKSLFECFDMRYKGLYAYDLFQWICAKSENQRITVLVEVFFIYFAVFYIVFSMARQIGMNQQKMVKSLAIAICLLPFYSQLSYMRSAIATSFVVIAIWRDLGLNKRNIQTLVCYSIGCTFHQSAWVFVGLRLILFALVKRPKLAAIVIIGITASIGIGAKIFAGMGGPVGELLSMAQNYSTGEVSQTDWAKGLAASTYNDVSRIVFAALLIICVVAILKKESLFNKNPIWSFITFAAIFCIGTFAFEMPVYERFTYCLIPFFSITLLSMPIHLFGKARIVNSVLISAFAISGICINGYLLYNNVDCKTLLLAIIKGPLMMCLH